jgi:hypothetical protein
MIIKRRIYDNNVHTGLQFSDCNSDDHSRMTIPFSLIAILAFLLQFSNRHVPGSLPGFRVLASVEPPRRVTAPRGHDPCELRNYTKRVRLHEHERQQHETRDARDARCFCVVCDCGACWLVMKSASVASAKKRLLSSHIKHAARTSQEQSQSDWNTLQLNGRHCVMKSSNETKKRHTHATNNTQNSPKAKNLLTWYFFFGFFC